MYLRIIFIAVFIAGILPVKLKAQYYFYDMQYYESPVNVEVGIAAGAMNCFTDLGTRKSDNLGFLNNIVVRNFKLCYGANVGVYLGDKIAFRLEYNRGQITAYDSLLKRVESGAGRYNRNLDFRSNISEFVLSAEVYPVMLFYSGDGFLSDVTPYITAGVGIFSFNPQTVLNGAVVDLAPLRLEGQGFKEYPMRKAYKTTQMCFPFGAGIRVDINAKLSFRLEIKYRLLRTDYLDDVSTGYINPENFDKYLSVKNAQLAHQLYARTRVNKPEEYADGAVRGNYKNNDAYYSLNLGVSFNLTRKKRN